MHTNIITRSELNSRIRQLKAERDGLLLSYIEAHEEMSYPAIGKLFELVPTHVSTIALKNGVRRKRGKKPNKQVSE